MPASRGCCSRGRLHAIVYFWLIPAYIAFYVLLPQAAGGRLYSDKMGRIAFLLLLIFSMPIGIHHLFADPQIGAGFKFLHAVFTGMVAVPTLLTIFTICASLEIAGRLRGGRGLFGWIAALPWDRPFVLASALSLVMLGLGGASGLINMSYALNSTVHNTQWVTGHFHLIYGGAIVIMYFAIAYELWPRLTGRPLAAPKLVRLQLWTWFVGMLLVTAAVAPGRRHGTAAAHGLLRFHRSRAGAAGDLGQPIGDRRLRSRLLRAAADRRAARVASRAECGGSAAQIFARGQSAAPPCRHRSTAFGVWVLLVVALTVANYGYPLAQFLFLDNTGVPAFPVSGTMTDADQPTSPDSRFAVWIGATVALFVVAVLVGFVWLPSAQRGADGLDLWSAICRAVGLPSGSARASAPVAGQPASTGCLDGRDATSGLRKATPRAAPRIATDLQQLPRRERHQRRRGVPEPGRPERGGDLQAARGLQERQARPGRDGRVRCPVVGAGHARPCDALCVAAESLRAASATQGDPADTAARHLIEVGAPLRGIAPCAACHGPLGLTPGAPGLARPAARLSRTAAAGLQGGQSAQRHQRADAQRCPPVDQRRDRDACCVLFEHCRRRQEIRCSRSFVRDR